MPDLTIPPGFTGVHQPAHREPPVVMVAVNGQAFCPERVEGLGVHFPKDTSHDVHISMRLVVKADEVAKALSVLAGVGG